MHTNSDQRHICVKRTRSRRVNETDSNSSCPLIEFFPGRAISARNRQRSVPLGRIPIYDIDSTRPSNLSSSESLSSASRASISSNKFEWFEARSPFPDKHGKTSEIFSAVLNPATIRGSASRSYLRSGPSAEAAPSFSSKLRIRRPSRRG